MQEAYSFITLSYGRSLIKHRTDMYSRKNIFRGGQLIAGAMLVIASITANAQVQTPKEIKPVQISGVYPHLAVFNDHSSTKDQNGAVSNYNTYNDGGECGIGAVVPWAGRLWMITYSPPSPARQFR